jgi:DHA3 family macrolide efflux protein-like MFS transporter
LNSTIETGPSIKNPHAHSPLCGYSQHRIAFHHAGQFIGKFSDQLFLFVMIWYLLTKTHSAIQVGIFLLCGAIPAAIISPFGGIITARYQWQKLLAALNLFRCILVLIIAGSFYNQSISIWMLDVGAAILALGGAFYNPTNAYILPGMLTPGHSTTAITHQFWMNAGALTGVLAGGFFYHFPGISFILMMCAMTYMVAALLECWFPMPTAEATTAVCNSGQLPFHRIIGRSLIPTLRTGFDDPGGHRQLFPMMSVFLLVNLLIWTLLLIFIPYVFKIIIKLSALELALAQGAYWAGVVIGITVITIEPPKERLKSMLLKSYICIAILTLLLALPLLPVVKTSLTVWSVTIIYIILAIFLGLVNVAVNLRMGVFLHNLIAPDFRDRIWAWFGSILAFGGSLSFLIGGCLTQTVPVYWLFIGNAVGIVLLIAVMAQLSWQEMN